MKNNLLTVFIATLIIVGSSCNQLKEVTTLSKCQFKLASIQEIQLAGVNIQNLTDFSQLNLQNAAKITAAVADGRLPLSFTLNVDVKNPNITKASLNSLDWILIIDDIEMLNGTVNQKFEVAPSGGITTVPVKMEMDLKQILKGKSGEALLNFGFNLVGAGNKPTRITLKAKPSIMIGGRAIQYPGYINIRNEFTS